MRAIMAHTTRTERMDPVDTNTTRVNTTPNTAIKIPYISEVSNSAVSATVVVAGRG
jgi:hypothetical protein